MFCQIAAQLSRPPGENRESVCKVRLALARSGDWTGGGTAWCSTAALQYRSPCYSCSITAQSHCFSNNCVATLLPRSSQQLWLGLVWRGQPTDHKKTERGQRHLAARPPGSVRPAQQGNPAAGRGAASVPSAQSPPDLGAPGQSWAGEASRRPHQDILLSSSRKRVCGVSI